MKKLLTIIMLVTSATNAEAIRWSISTNLLDYLNLLTLNIETSASINRNWSTHIRCRYNPTIILSEQNSSHLSKIALSSGVKYWPFYVYSGFHYDLKIQWTRYNIGGITSPTTYAGDAYGLGISFGYALMLTKHLNMDFGIGLWGGYTPYKKYAAPRCGKYLGSFNKWFVAPSDIHISLSYCF